MTAEVLYGNCLELLPTLADASIDAVVCDPPYPCIKRSYGYWTEAEWFALMDRVVPECRRVLKPTGSAVFILQPNSERVGRMRTWLWDFMAKWGREWGIVQDVWWWNFTCCPTIHCNRNRGLTRPSVKSCVWLGGDDCYRNQEAVLWAESQRSRDTSRSDRCLNRQPSGNSMRKGRCSATSDSRGGTTPFNLLPIANNGNGDAHGHGAGTPLALCRWWTRYICPPDGKLLDPFAGSGTTGVAAVMEGRNYIGMERVSEYVDVTRKRIAAAQAEYPLFAEVPA